MMRAPFAIGSDNTYFYGGTSQLKRKDRVTAMSFISISSAWSKGVGLICALLLSAICVGQISQPSRIEIPLRANEEIGNFTVVSAQTEGLVIYSQVITKDN